MIFSGQADQENFLVWLICGYHRARLDLAGAHCFTDSPQWARAPWSGLILVRFGEADRYGCWQDIFADLAMRIAERSSAVNGESKP
jgi:hypothetical protein